jgi:hypothetical protein
MRSSKERGICISRCRDAIKRNLMADHSVDWTMRGKRMHEMELSPVSLPFLPIREAGLVSVEDQFHRN